MTPLAKLAPAPSRVRGALLAAALLPVVLSVSAPAVAAWRSALYPVDARVWTPDSAGRILQDFSNAGFGAGARVPSPRSGRVFDVSQSPYLADRSGLMDATAAIQSALDAAAQAGGGVVLLPPGTYLIRPPPNARAALQIAGDGVVLRGAGTDKTFLVSDATDMRHQRLILARAKDVSDSPWYEGGPTSALTRDAAIGDVRVRVTNPNALRVGDSVVLRIALTPGWIAEHGMTGKWTPGNTEPPALLRKIVAIDADSGEITVDHPLRVALRVRDGALIARVPRPLQDVGVEHLAIGQIALSGALGDEDYAVLGTAAYRLHESFAIWFHHVEDSWIDDVRSFRPAANAAPVHLLSNGIRIDSSRFVTISRTRLEGPQYRGEGGNGYLFVLTGSDCLIRASEARGGRHNLSFAFARTTGNVVHDTVLRDGRLPADFHQKLSAANLLDNVTVDGDALEAAERRCCDHGHGSTEAMFWNTHGLRYAAGQFLAPFIVQSTQFGHGYVIGTRGAANGVRSVDDRLAPPLDWVEGVGQGDDLEPPSLFVDQRKRRFGDDAGAPPSNDRDAGKDVDDAAVSAGPQGTSAQASTDAPASAEASSGCHAALQSRETSPLPPLVALLLPILLRLRRRGSKVPGH